MKRVLKILGATLLVLMLAAGGFYGWATITTQATLTQTFTAHDVDIPVPFPLSEAELEALRERLAGVNSQRPTWPWTAWSRGTGHRPTCWPAWTSTRWRSRTPSPAGSTW
ncbi:MAG: hypothetical protein IPG17_17610 [Sandaracinaceae bacterium]|nr:hypothetical protein [Sandaracinaceae bacterium]